jgi:hypothetical protein
MKPVSTADPNLVILTGENPFIRLAATDADDYTTNASFWRIIFSPGGPGHVLYLKGELTGNRWRIWTDNIAMARWLQDTVQGMLNGELKDKSIQQERRLPLVLDRESGGTRRGSGADLVRSG